MPLCPRSVLDRRRVWVPTRSLGCCVGQGGRTARLPRVAHDNQRWRQQGPDGQLHRGMALGLARLAAHPGQGARRTGPALETMYRSCSADRQALAALAALAKIHGVSVERRLADRGVRQVKRKVYDALCPNT